MTPQERISEQLWRTYWGVYAIADAAQDHIEMFKQLTCSFVTLSGNDFYLSSSFDKFLDGSITV